MQDKYPESHYLFKVTLDGEFICVLDGADSQCNARNINHHCIGNCEVLILRDPAIETPAKRQTALRQVLAKVCIVAKRKILRDEQLSYPYCWSWRSTRLRWRCGAIGCRTWLGEPLSAAEQAEAQKVEAKKLRLYKRNGMSSANQIIIILLITKLWLLQEYP